MDSVPVKNTRWRWRWKVILIVVPLALVLGIVLLLAGIMAREVVLAHLAMRNQKAEEEAAAEKLLSWGWNVPGGAPPSATLARSPGDGNALIAASLSRPLIDDESGWPVELKRNRDVINARFSAFMRDVAAFERERDQMEPKAAEKRLREIDQFLYNQILHEIDRLRPTKEGERSPFETVENFHNVVATYGNWAALTHIALLERMGEYMRAGYEGRMMLRNHYEDWVMYRDHPDAWVSRYQANHYRKHGDAEYHRVIYDYWREGGADGYSKLLIEAGIRMHDKIVDRMRWGREP